MTPDLDDPEAYATHSEPGVRTRAILDGFGWEDSRVGQMKSSSLRYCLVRRLRPWLNVNSRARSLILPPSTSGSLQMMPPNRHSLTRVIAQSLVRATSNASSRRESEFLRRKSRPGSYALVVREGLVRARIVEAMIREAML